MPSSAAKYVVVNENTLCFRQHRSEQLGVMAGNIHGRDWKDGPILPGQRDAIRPATEDDFRRFRCVLPRDFGQDADTGHRLTVVEMTAGEYQALRVADETFQRELERAYGAARVGDARYYGQHADPAVQSAAAAFAVAGDAWHRALREARAVVAAADAAMCVR